MLGNLLGSAVVAAVVAGLVAYFNAERAIALKYVTNERAAWRDKLRDMARNAIAEPSLANSQTLWVGLSLNLNPLMQQDRELIAVTKRLMDERFDRALQEEVLIRLGLLLKHDWERAKSEAGVAHGSLTRWDYDAYISARDAGELDGAIRYWSGQCPVGRC